MCCISSLPVPSFKQRDEELIPAFVFLQCDKMSHFVFQSRQKRLEGDSLSFKTQKTPPWTEIILLSYSSKYFYIRTCFNQILCVLLLPPPRLHAATLWANRKWNLSLSPLNVQQRDQTTKNTWQKTSLAPSFIIIIVVITPAIKEESPLIRELTFSLMFHL